jgi:hypothetical protein
MIARGTVKITLASPGLDFNNYSLIHPSSTLARPAEGTLFSKSGFRSENYSP